MKGARHLERISNMYNKYSDAQLTAAYEKLTDEQKYVLDEQIKRGKKTKWLNSWAKKKGNVLTDEDLNDIDAAMNKLLEWVLVDYEDSLRINPETKCECGRALRYRYTVLHKSTGKQYKLGIVHLEQHTGLNPELVTEIKKGMKEIDVERDEILSKVIDGWYLPFDIPISINIPAYIKEQLRVDLPLLDRQVVRLTKLITDYKKPIKRSKKKTTSHIQLQMGIDINNELEAPSDTENFVKSLEPGYLLNKLKSNTLDYKEAAELLSIFKNNYDKINQYITDKYQLLGYINRALGKTSHIGIRESLVEIEALIKLKMYE